MRLARTSDRAGVKTEDLYRLRETVTNGKKIPEEGVPDQKRKGGPAGLEATLGGACAWDSCAPTSTHCIMPISRLGGTQVAMQARVLVPGRVTVGVQ